MNLIRKRSYRFAAIVTGSHDDREFIAQHLGLQRNGSANLELTDWIDLRDCDGALASAATKIHASNADILAIVGNDCFQADVVSAANQAYGENPLPHLLLLPTAGMSGRIATWLASQRTHRLIRKVFEAINDNLPLRVRSAAVGPRRCQVIVGVN